MQSNKDNPVLNDYLTIVALEDGLTAKLSVNACEYCVDGDGVWKTLPANTATEPINAGQTLSFRGNLTPNSSDGIGTFTINKYHNLKGNCMSMLFGDNGKDCFSFGDMQFAFKTMFAKCSNLIDASVLNLPATQLGYGCYAYMFSQCENLFAAPNLPAENLAINCYAGMFFKCYNLLFAPVLPAKSILWNSYNHMFNSCSKLNYIKAIFTSTPGANYTLSWLESVSPTGTFVKNKDATWNVRGGNGIPEDWTVITE